MVVFGSSWLVMVVGGGCWWWLVYSSWLVVGGWLVGGEDDKCLVKSIYVESFLRTSNKKLYSVKFIILKITHLSDIRYSPCFGM